MPKKRYTAELCCHAQPGAPVVPGLACICRVLRWRELEIHNMLARFVSPVTLPEISGPDRKW